MISCAQQVGRDVEDLARSYLIEAGLNTVTTNYSCRWGEVDLIMRDRDDLVFVEVRYRQDDNYGGAVASVTKSKQHKIIRAAKCYLQNNGLWDKVPCRFDVLVVQDFGGQKKIRWIKDAFWASVW